MEVEAEQSAFWLRAFGPYWVSTWIMILCNAVFPQILWFKKARTHIPTLFVLSVLINIGMWFERYVIIISGLSREYDPAVWGVYTPTWVELSMLAGGFAFFAMLFILFLKIFPVIAISEAVEDAAGRDDTSYSLGSVLNHVLLHQTIIGQEALAQMELAGAFPDVVIGCVGPAVCAIFFAAGEPDGFAKLLYGKQHGELPRRHLVLHLPGAAPSDAHVRQAPTMQNLAIGAV